MSSSGPYNKFYSVAGSVTLPFYHGVNKPVVRTVKQMAVRRVWFRTNKGDTRKPLPFLSNLAFASGCDTDELYARTVAFSPLTYVSKEVNLSYNRAYADFKEKAYDSAQWLVNAGERRQAAVMIGNRVKQLLDLVTDLEHGRVPKSLKKAWKAYRKKHPGNKARSAARNAADTFLEWHFGWGPILDDITVSLEILCKDYGGIVVRGKGQAPFETGRVRNDTFGFNDRVSGTVRHLIRGNVKIENPNAFLLEQMGLVNVASVGWELIPFSFLVDHVINIGACLASLTDFLGMFIEDSSITMFVSASSGITFWDTGLVGHQPIYDGDRVYYSEIYGKRYWGASGDAYLHERSIGWGTLPPPTLEWQAKLPGLTRGLTYCSLLAQGLRDLTNSPPRAWR